MSVTQGDVIELDISHDATKISFHCRPEGSPKPDREDE